MIRLGLCCIFHEAPIRFPTTTAMAVSRLDRKGQLEKLAALCRENARALGQAVEFCAAQEIGAFRINSQILPLKTHPQVGYRMAELPGGEAIVEAFRLAGRQAARHRIRLTMHPDQFVVLNSPDSAVVASSVAELEYQAEFAGWVGVDVINVHGGGIYGAPAAALERLEQTLRKLPEPVRCRLTLENDDRRFAPADLLPVCRRTGVPLVYDVHHHRCHPDGMTIEAATAAAIGTWGGREPLFHISSPKSGWQEGEDPRPHHDYIDPADFPACWRSLDATVDIEAKAKEVAIARLRKALAGIWN